jgi:hypothetical protein
LYGSGDAGGADDEINQPTNEIEEEERTNLRKRPIQEVEK